MHTGPNELRILIADRPGPARSALASLLCALDDVAVVGAEGSAAGLASALRRLRPDVVVMDDHLVADWRAPYDVEVHLVIVGVDDDPTYPARAARRGAIAWVPKECAGDDLVAVLDRIRRSLSLRTPPAPLALPGARGSVR